MGEIKYPVGIQTFIEALYLGKPELFEGLYIFDKKWDWVKHPVFHLALSYQDYDSVEKLDEVLHFHLQLWERQYGVVEGSDNDKIRHYWFASGNPSFLNKVIKEREWDLSNLNGSTRSEQSLSGSDVYLTDPVPLMYQSGYLTIKGYKKRFNEYVLGFPNEEVTQGFAEGFLKYISDEDDPQSFIKNFTRYVERGDAEEFMSALQSFLADFPYDQIRDLELHWQNIMYLIMKLMGFYVQTEYKTSDGRIDMVVKTDGYIYVMEFKLESTSKAAMQQIRDKEYALPFMSDGREVILIGAAFSSRTRRLKKWIIEKA